jgi:hypothetical protein
LSSTINTTLAPLMVPTKAIVAGLRAALDKQRNDRNEIESLESKDFDALIAVMDSTQKQRIVEFIRASYGTDPEEISRENERQSKLRALRNQEQADYEDAPLVNMLALYENVTNETVEVSANDAVLRYLSAPSESNTK